MDLEEDEYFKVTLDLGVEKGGLEAKGLKIGCFIDCPFLIEQRSTSGEEKIGVKTGFVTRFHFFGVKCFNQSCLLVFFFYGEYEEFEKRQQNVVVHQDL